MGRVAVAAHVGLVFTLGLAAAEGDHVHARQAAGGGVLRLDEIAAELGQTGRKAPDDDTRAEIEVLKRWLALQAEMAALKKKQQREAESRLDQQAHDRYAAPREADVKALVVNDKWLPALDAALHAELDRASRQLTQRVKELAERYEAPMPLLASRVAEFEAKVAGHLERMGFAWN